MGEGLEVGQHVDTSYEKIKDRRRGGMIRKLEFAHK